MVKEPLVSITIPTLNNEKTLRRTLQSVSNQTYKNIEIIVVDSNSTDKTLSICKEFKNVKVYQYKGILLGARKLGAEKAKGVFVALVDSDHVLEKSTIKTAVAQSAKYDMQWLYERSFKPRRILEVLYDADRVLTQNYSEDYIEPVGGTILPRFYKRSLLIQAFNNMPKEAFPFCVAHDHAIIYLECNKLSKKVGRVGSYEKPAIWHQEPWSWSNLFKKTYRYGVTTRKLIEKNIYPELLQSKNKGRKIEWRAPLLTLKSNILRALRAGPYLYGYYTGKNKEIPGL